MTCKRLREQFDDYIDANLDDAEMTRLTQHADTCDACQQLIDREHRLQSSLKEYGNLSMPTPDGTFFDHALIAAARAGKKQQHKRSWMTGFGSAVAAGLAIWIVSSVFFTTTEMTQTNLPTITMAVEEPHTVNLVFSSASDLPNATLTVLLPEGFELAGFEGQREVTWMTNLSAGKNLLPLRLIATRPASGELVATLRHGEDDRTFYLRVTAA